MNDATLFDNTKMAAYFLWEHTGCENALDLWLCAEDMACFFEQTDILGMTQIEIILRLGKYDPGYVNFMQHVAFRIYQYTGCSDELRNWFSAERLLTNTEWSRALTQMAAIYRSEKKNQNIMNDVRSENVRAFYDEQTLYTR